MMAHAINKVKIKKMLILFEKSLIKFDFHKKNSYILTIKIDNNH